MHNALINRVYVWQLPVRFYHWINAFAVTTLAITGYFIGWPLSLQTGAEASEGGEVFLGSLPNSE